MVLQRQVPARPAAKAGDGFAAGDTAGGNRSDAFSAALSQEKRGSTAERETAPSVNPVGIDEEASAVDQQEPAAAGQSDEIMALLSGLKSSAAYTDEAELGNSGSAEEPAPEAALPVQSEVEAEDGSGLSEAVEKAEGAAPALQPGSAPSTAELADTVPVDKASAGAATNDKTMGSEPRQIPAAQVPGTVPGNGSERAGNQPQNDARATSTPAQVASATAGLAAQPQPRAPEPSSRTDTQKDSSAVKEAMRALGVGGEAGAVNVDAAKTQARDRNAGRQDGADDRRIDDLASKKDGKVEVIESRRFMPAQNLSANAQMLTRSLAEASSNALAAQRSAPVQALAQTGAPQAGQTLHTLKLQLNPVSLGSITAVLKLSGEDLSVEIKVQTAEAYRQISDDNQSILKALRGQGFGVEQISVQHVVGNDRVSGQPAQPGFQSSQQGAGSNDAQTFSQDGERNSAGQQQSGSRGGQSHEQSSYAGSGAGRTDGVYL